jgi:hypothetical protein
MKQKIYIYPTIVGLLLSLSIAPMLVFAMHAADSDHETEHRHMSGRQTEASASDCVEHCLATYSDSNIQSATKHVDVKNLIDQLNSRTFQFNQFKNNTPSYYSKYILNQRQPSPHTILQKIE